MRNARQLLVFAFLIGIIALTATSVLADARINVIHHFGGDVLFCTHSDGCWMLTMHGDPLWSVEQSLIDDAMEAACASGEIQTIDAGAGTYGEFTLTVSCPSSLWLTGYDEWGKTNTMPFTTDYLPVNAPPDAPDRCAFDTSLLPFIIAPPARYIIASSDENLHPIALLYWSDTDEGLPACNLTFV